ncbi:hypothetical protein LK09_03275 [Microbacterium mangrovi]|uniref:Glycosyltransferase subfamily 4-like N-terminal domain-containing protein n=2 Tax=Microbacterium mangrovi TaxID=1348253 RepID=A0A0B2AC52_9MICO|nr:hypothetical protein LK09_03275 [Microbacterium mangrovi]
MRLLWLSNETPDVGGQGGQRRQYFQIREFVRAGIAVDVVTLAGPQSDESLRGFASVERIVRSRRRKPIRTIRGMAALRRRLRSGSYDAVVVAHTESWPLIRRRALGGHLDVPVLVDLHNVWSAWADARGDDDAARRWRDREAEILRVADAVSVCSPLERERLGGSGTAERIVAPHGIDPDEWPEVPRDDTGAMAVGAFGNWDWFPNRSGIDWFVDEVWPEVRGRVPGAEFVVAGGGLPDAVAGLDGVRYLGRIADLGELRRQVDVMVTPVREGVGAPVKFAEALATGRAVLATTDAAGAQHPAGTVISDDPAEWADALTGLLRDPGLARSRGRAVRSEALEHLTWRRTTAPLIDWVAQRADEEP